MEDRAKLNRMTSEMISAAMQVHSAVGPGLLESAYQACLAYELIERRLKVEREKPLPVSYKHMRLDCGYRLDLVVDNSVIVETMAVEQLTDVHRAQLLTYLRFSDLRVGLLINFHVKSLRTGIQRVVNDF